MGSGRQVHEVSSATDRSVTLFSHLKSSVRFSHRLKPCSIQDRSSLSVMTLRTSQHSHQLISSSVNRSQPCLNHLWNTHHSHHQQDGNLSRRRCNSSGLNGQLTTFSVNSPSPNGIILPMTSRSGHWCSSLTKGFLRASGHLLGFSHCILGRMVSPGS